MLNKLSFTLTLSDGRQYTLWRGSGLIPPDAVEVVTGSDHAIYRTGAIALLALYFYGEDGEQPAFTFECSSVEEAEELALIVKANEADGRGWKGH
jgi:hypothetical protein